MTWAAVAVGGALVVGAGGAYMASESNKKAARMSAEATRYAADAAAQAQWDMYDQTRTDFQPYLKAGQDVGLPGLTSMAEQAPPGQQYVNQLATLGQDFKLEGDPFYEAAKGELMRTLGNKYSARGLSGSSAEEDAIVRNLYPLMTGDLSRRQGNLLNLYNLEKDMSGTQYGRYLDLAKIGAGAATSAGSASMTTGSNLSNIAMNQGNALSNIYQQQGQNQAQFYSGLGAMPLQAYSAYSMNQPYGGYGAYPNSGNALGQGSQNISTVNTSGSPFAGGGFAYA